jgi:hypothetical protein
MFKKVILAAVVVAAVSAMSFGVSATVNDNTNGSGSVDVPARATRAAESEYVYDSNGEQAGYWIHGHVDSNVVSKFKAYGNRDGRASVTNGNGKFVDGGWRPSGTLSEASTTWSSAGTNKANYDYRAAQL